MLWPFEFLESFHCSILRVSIYYAHESDLRVKSYDNLNCTWAFIVHFQASQYIIHPNRTSAWKVVTIWISRELPLLNSSVLIYYEPESDLRVKSYDHLNFSRASVVQFLASRYINHLNRISEWKVMTIWISREFPLFNFLRLDILWASIEPSSKNVTTIWIAQQLPFFNFERLDILWAWIGPPS